MFRIYIGEVITGHKNANKLNTSRVNIARFKPFLIGFGILAVLAVIVWQAVVFAGNPNPGEKNLNITAAILSCGVLVFREGLEAILVLSAITATVTRRKDTNYGKGVTVGAGLGLLATIATWFIVVAILSSIDLPELDIQAATGLLAIVVLLVVMNWFFHKVYWTGWISHHTKQGKRLLDSSDESQYRMFQGFALLGFTAIYREGFEVVLFLQQLRLQDGANVVLTGAAIGVLLTAIVAVLTFIAHKHLPYKKMLIFTGILLGVVLLVMVGESVQEMQQANWIPATSIGISLPDWLGVWFAVFPNIQGLLAQAGAALLVLGSYLIAQNKFLIRPTK
jgi:high-affinity iron transporter